VKRILQAPSSRQVVGRFAPSPTGELHFGSLLAAVGSFLNARSQNGEWLIRIENIDPPREVAGAGRDQIDTLARHGLESDRDPVWQIESTKRHDEVIQALLQQGLAFHCGCTRADLPDSGVYPGTCRDGLPAGRPARSVRLLVDGPGPVEFVDAIQGPCRQNPARDCGDFVIRRADGLIAYQLAVVVDDALAGVSEVIRGSDLIESTGRQMLVYRALGLPPPRYGHLPLVVDAAGRKLSKSAQDSPIRHGPPAENLRRALACLGHPPPADLDEVTALLDWGIEHWRIENVPRGPCAIPDRAAAH
jgi:glutamyl-Q tRNA(Asp) synthetase